jgi:hypothetical protein
MVHRIYEYGDQLSTLVTNLGNVFREYHTDLYLRYPETNQIAVDFAERDGDESQKVFRAAIEWSLLQRKPELQGTAPGSDRKDIYTLNRIFSPVFEISYRTRGGHSEEYTNAEFCERYRKSGARAKLVARTRADDPQMFFDMSGE